MGAIRLVIALLMGTRLAQAGDAPVLRLRIGEMLPAEPSVALDLVRLADGARLTLAAGEPLIDIAPGAYRFGDGMLLLRPDDSAAGYARSTVGLPVVRIASVADAQRVADLALGHNALSLVIDSWRRGDGWDWPWIIDAGYWDGLAGMCRRFNPARDGYPFDPAQRAYVAFDGKPIAVVATGDPARPLAFAPGDVVAMDGVIGLFAVDRGEAGVLDPADEVVTAAPPADGGPAQVRMERIGALFAAQPLFLFSRDRAGAERLRNPQDRAQTFRRDLTRMQPWQRWMIYAGIALMALVLFRFQLKTRRRMRQRERLRPPWP